MKAFFRNLLSIVLILLLVGTGDWWLNSRSKGEATPRRITTVWVESTVPVRRTLRPEYRFRGELRPSQRVEVRFEVSGRVLENQLVAGLEVEQGQVLLEVEDLDFRDVVRVAQARLRRERGNLARDRELLSLAGTEVELLEKERERLGELSKRSLAALSKVDETQLRLLRGRAELARLRHNVSAANATLQTLEAELRAAQRRLERARLRAPFSGTINRVRVEEGEYIGPERPALELLRLDPLELRIWIPGKAATMLHRGRPLPLQVDGVGQAPSEVRSLEPAADPLTHTHQLRLWAPSAPGLRPGLLATVRLPGPPLEDALALPVGALLREAGGVYVFRINEGQLERVAVQVLLEQDGWAAISGLEDGAQVVAADVATLASGQQVRVRDSTDPGSDSSGSDS